MHSLIRDFSLSTVTAGFVAVLVGITSSIALIYQAATAFGANTAQVSSWMWALGIGIGLCTALPSLWLKQPVMVAWSTAGAALLATAGAAGGFGLGEAIGAFIISAALVVLFGITGWFEGLTDRIPMPLANALLAGVLARFGMDAFIAFKSAFGLLLWMLTAYLIARRLWPRYAVAVVLAAGVAYAGLHGDLHWQPMTTAFTLPVFTAPVFSWQAAISLALPLFVVTMASQNVPGVAAIRAAGYRMPISALITMIGVVNLLLAPFGAFVLNFAAITASICMSPEAHEDPARRYTATVACGLFYIVMGLFGAVIAGLLAAFPRELVIAIAGFALLGTIGGALASALKDESHREASLITFLVTLSGLNLWGIGSAFWGVVAGALALFVQQWRRSKE